MVVIQCCAGSYCTAVRISCVYTDIPPPSAFVPAPRSSLQAITEHPAELRPLTTLYFLQCLEKMSLPVIGSFQIFVNAKFPSYWIFYICNFILQSGSLITFSNHSSLQSVLKIELINIAIKILEQFRLRLQDDHN